ncbi:hydantoinase/oxoprolinase family protein [Salinicola rhizosphaerae]|uniref:Methylhydantoinase n=1 Tax=Salinicola rhizosphaerae TaxID=1443141 RepID=A0ABQ3DUW4_9GAMM|nr:hydantoinase/oxoprolinase family protein [Salinicola rhizosphaerae]GHB17156.1 methylhydantoinase [Salinicola rhizosphaerae]
MYRITFDIGGTFTDFVLEHVESGERHFAKILSTHHAPAEAVLKGVRQLTEQHDVAPGQIEAVLHATTIATNAIIERKGARTALLTTRGFRDILLIGRQKRYETFDLHLDKPEPLIARRDIFEIDERVLFDGSIETPLVVDALDDVLDTLVERGYEAVAICLLHAYVNPIHETQIAERIAERGLALAVTRSSIISPRIREYERTSTTVADAYVKPMVKHYVDTLRRELSAIGVDAPLSVIQSNGGLITPAIATEKPINIVESGPAAGVLMCAEIGRQESCDHVLSFDMGGTTAKLGAIDGGEPAILSSFEVDQLRYKPGSGLPLNISAIELLEIGAGGGSIANLDMGLLKIGPESAGSNPGPICYGNGGERPTVTDANLVLGYLDPGYFNGGAMSLESSEAADGIRRHVAEPLGLSVEQAAWGIHTMANANMERATRIVSVERGRDPRQYAMVAFGGAGPLHAVRLAMAVGISRVIIPVGAGVGSALGLLVAEPRLDYSTSKLMILDQASDADVAAVVAELKARAADDVAKLETDGLEYRFSANLRYRGQGFELRAELAFAGDTLDRALTRDNFARQYRQSYGYDEAEAPIEITDWHLTVTRAPTTRRAPTPEADEVQAVKHRRAWFPECDGYVDTPVYRRRSLTPEVRIDGPAIVEESESTVVIPPGNRVHVSANGNLVIDIAVETQA